MEICAKRAYGSNMPSWVTMCLVYNLLPVPSSFVVDPGDMGVEMEIAPFVGELREPAASRPMPRLDALAPEEASEMHAARNRAIMTAVKCGLGASAAATANFATCVAIQLC